MSQPAGGVPTGSGAGQAGVSVGVPARAEELACRLDKPMGALGLVFLFIVLGQIVTEDAGPLAAFTVAGWVLWLVFVAEFTLRAVVAREPRRF